MMIVIIGLSILVIVNTFGIVICRGDGWYGLWVEDIIRRLSRCRK
jgi:ABC-type dipeptide/oligopeptide/nickel transport system permease subunit